MEINHVIFFVQKKNYFLQSKSNKKKGKIQLNFVVEEYLVEMVLQKDLKVVF